MDTDKHELELDGERSLLHGKLVFDIVGCAMEVLAVLGHGLSEKTYENAMVVELGLCDIPCDQQKEFDVIYKDVKISHYIPDLLVENSVIVDLKVIDRIGDHELGQMLNYLRICQLRVGVILNLHRRKLEWKRVVL